MKTREIAGTLALGLALCCASAVPAAAQEKAPAADNTKVNKRDREKGAVTADQAKDNAADRDIMQKIRKSLMDDKTLSTAAHNVKVVSQNGKVTIKGPVNSEEEKRTIEQKATEVAGAGNVTNEISVKAAKKKTS